jgi:putative alpha-1,2-mannosidase
MEGPEKANNGTWNGGTSDKWCDNVSADKWWQVDLGAAKSIDKIVLHHAAAGGESSEWNTQDFTLEISSDASAWTTFATVTGNKDDVTTHTAASPSSARYVRLRVTKPDQSGPPGEWACLPFDPGAECGFIEGNAAQYVWMVPQNLEALSTMMGGHDAAARRLDDLFVELNAGTNRPHFYIGNEPEHGTPWTYNFVQAPSKTQAVVRRIMNEEFDTTAGGLPGNDDLGATSAWLVWAYLGLYPVIPGTDVLVLHGPTFPSATLRLANGKTLTINGAGAGPGAPFVQSLQVNGVTSTKSWLRFADLSGGATLDYAMGPEASAWATGAADVPPSFAP